VTGTGGSHEKNYFFADGGLNAVRNCEVGLFFDVTPDSTRSSAACGTRTKRTLILGLAFQICQVIIQLIFRDSFAAVELLDAAPDLSVDCFPVLQEPTILFCLDLQQTEQDFLDAAREAVAWSCFWILALRAASWISMLTALPSRRGLQSPLIVSERVIM
jgi:hypothetical protein